MKIYISLDMEGIPGTYNWEHENLDRGAVKNCMFNHLKDIVNAIQSSPQNQLIEEITIADSHMSGDNISYDFTSLDSRLTLISGGPRPYYMMPAFSGEYDQVFFVGYHASTGALKGNMDHSYSNRRVHKIWINEIPMSEATINAAFAGFHSVPVTLISGDKTFSQEILAPNVMPWVNFVVTKEAVSKFSAKNYSSLLIKERTYNAVYQALSKRKKDYPLYTFHPPITLKIEFQSTAMADIASKVPYCKRIDGRTISYTDDNYDIIFESIMVFITLASTVNL